MSIKKEFLNNLTPECLTENMRFLAEICGMEITIKLMESFPGIT